MYLQGLEVRDVLGAMILLIRQCTEYTDFYILILYAATLGNSFISSNRFLVDENLRIFYVQDYIIYEWHSFASSFPLRMPLISFSCLPVWLEPQCCMELKWPQWTALSCSWSQGKAFSPTIKHDVRVGAFVDIIIRLRKGLFYS